MSKILEISNLKKSYGHQQILKNLSFSVAKGEFFGLLGHNGAGKSTAIDCVLGMKKYDEGKITLLGSSPGKTNKTIFEKIGVQFQQSHYQNKIKVG